MAVFHDFVQSCFRLSAIAAVAISLTPTVIAVSIRTSSVKSGPYLWPHARGDPSHYSSTRLVGPQDMNRSFSWKWHHPDGAYHTTVVGGPLLDDKKNIYLAAEDGIRKFSPDGKLLWTNSNKSLGPITTCPSLMDGKVFGNSAFGYNFAIDMQTGQDVWVQKHAATIAGDTAYVESYDGVVVSGVDSGPGGGAMRVLGLDGKTGHKLWEWRNDVQLWNLMALRTPDDSVIFMDIHGGVYKLGLHNGVLRWKTKPPEVSSRTFSDGGVILGPDGTSYTCSNYEGSGQEGEKGALRAYALDSGHMLWEQILDKPCNSWPVVTQDGATVVVPSGSFVDNPVASKPEFLALTKKSPAEMHDISLALGERELETFGLHKKRATVRAFNAKTGAPSWKQDLPAYGRFAAAGDEEGFLIRQGLHIRDQCLPAQFGSPTITGDGTVYVGRADGKLWAVRPDGHGADVKTFDTGAGFLHPGTSFAPGMMAVASCDGLFVWKY